MKTKLMAIVLFTMTSAVVAFYPKQDTALVNPVQQPSNPSISQAKQIELVFVLDTTGSMSGMIEATKQKIWSIATNIAKADSVPNIKIGLVAFRDRGDAYVTKLIDLSSDLDSVYAKLMDFRAGGGGDTPESVNQALYEAVHKISWSDNSQAYKAIFLAGDAPPHMDYQDDVKYPQTIQVAQAKGITVNAIQSGADAYTKQQWQQIASLGQGDFFTVAQNGSAVAIATPYDKQMAELSHKLDQTRLYYGDEKTREAKRKKQAATEKLHAAAPVSSRARRSTFNASKAGEANAVGEHDLVTDVEAGRVNLDALAEERLPEALRDKSLLEKEKLVEAIKEERESLQKQIQSLAQKRSDFIRQEVEKRGGATESLDEKLVGTIRQQAKEKGFSYSDESITY